MTTLSRAKLAVAHTTHITKHATSESGLLSGEGGGTDDRDRQDILFKTL